MARLQGGGMYGGGVQGSGVGGFGGGAGQPQQQPQQPPGMGMGMQQQGAASQQALVPFGAPASEWKLLIMLKYHWAKLS